MARSRFKLTSLMIHILTHFFFFLNIFIHFRLITHFMTGLLLSMRFGIFILFSKLSADCGGFEDLALKSNGISEPAADAAGRFVT